MIRACLAKVIFRREAHRKLFRQAQEQVMQFGKIGAVGIAAALLVLDEGVMLSDHEMPIGKLGLV